MKRLSGRLYPTWWCSACRAPQAEDTCTGCGALRELGLRHSQGAPEGPRLADARLNAYIVDELDPEPLPNREWPWLTYALISGVLAAGARMGFGRIFLEEWVLRNLGLFLLACLALMVFRDTAAVRQARASVMATQTWLRRIPDFIIHPCIPKRRYTRRLRVVRVDDCAPVIVGIPAPKPWPPGGFGAYSGPDALMTFVGMWRESRQFMADRIIPPVSSGYPMTIGAGHAQPVMWIGAGVGLLAIIVALTQ
jgi:hypothetical protein